MSRQSYDTIAKDMFQKTFFKCSPIEAKYVILESERRKEDETSVERPKFELTRANMTLRDYFAGQALAGMMSADTKMDLGKNPECIIAEGAYVIADAMLKARDK